MKERNKARTDIGTRQERQQQRIGNNKRKKTNCRKTSKGKRENEAETHREKKTNSIRGRKAERKEERE